MEQVSRTKGSQEIGTEINGKLLPGFWGMEQPLGCGTGLAPPMAELRMIGLGVPGYGLQLRVPSLPGGLVPAQLWKAGDLPRACSV